MVGPHPRKRVLADCPRRPSHPPWLGFFLSGRLRIANQRTRLGRAWSAMKPAIDRSISLRSAHASSAAILSLTSRDQPSAMLKATMPTGAKYRPSSRLRISIGRLVSATSVSDQAKPQLRRNHRARDRYLDRGRPVQLKESHACAPPATCAMIAAVRSNCTLPIAHHAYLFPVPIEIRPDVSAALAAWQTNRPSISDSRRSSGQGSPLMAIEWLQR